MAVYTTLLFRGTCLTGDTTAITTPAGYVDVIRDIDIVVVAGGTGGIFIFDNASGVSFWFIKPVPSNATLQWRGRQVLNAGDELVVENNNALDVDVWISGYRLTA